MADRASETAKTINKLMNISSADNEALLEVIQDYFLLPEEEEEDSEREYESDESMEGIVIVHKTLHTYTQQFIFIFYTVNDEISNCEDTGERETAGINDKEKAATEEQETTRIEEQGTKRTEEK